MRIIYSLQEFYAQVGEVAAKKGTDYYHVRIELHSTQGLCFICYCNGSDIHEGATPDEAIQKLRNKLWPPEKGITRDDVEIEMPEEIPVNAL